MKRDNIIDINDINSDKLEINLRKIHSFYDKTFSKISES